MDDSDDMTLDKFKLWSLNSLKVYLSQRKKSLDGSDEELAARAFCAWEEKLPVDEKGEQLELRLLEEYKLKLRVGGDIIPDPFSITTGWENEQNGMSKWPSLYVSDIAEFLNGKVPKEAVKRLLGEYKEGKGYRYFDCKWVKEVSYHHIRDSSNQCILKARVTPSMTVRKWYDTWVVVKKDSSDWPGGEIVSGYCTCTAGMFGTCNHVAGLLFRVEHAVKTGVTMQASTSRLCQWNVPKTKTEVKPVKVCEVPWTKGHYAKKTNKETEGENLRLKNAFTPLSKRQIENVKNEDSMRRQIYNLLQEDIPDSCFMLSYEKRRIMPKKVVLPQTLVSAGKTFKMERNGQDVKNVLSKSHLSEEHLLQVHDATLEQSESQDWFEQRKGRITASRFHRVVSRVRTLKTKENVDPSALVQEIMGRNKMKPTAAMKHGISMEPVAKKAYIQEMNKSHQKFKACDSGLTISTDKQYIAASADLKVTCSCCGEGLCEIKCPEGIKDSVPSDKNVKYVVEKDGILQVLKTHEYFFQIQGQMAILCRKYCDLFIYTPHGHMKVRVAFDQQFWEETVNSLSWFWERHVLPELLTLEQSPKEDKSPTKATNINNVRRVLQPLPIAPRVSVKQNEAKQLSRPRKLRKVSHKQPVYLCGHCGALCEEEPKCDAEQSVRCDICGVWVHYKCAQVDDLVNDQNEWTCAKCV